MQAAALIFADEAGAHPPRVHARRRCHLRLDRPGRPAAAVLEIGMGGMRLAVADLGPGDEDCGRLYLPGEREGWDVRFRVVHQGVRGQAGASFSDLSPTHRRRLARYVHHSRTVELLKQLQVRLGCAARNLKPVGGPEATRREVRRLAEAGAETSLYADERQPSLQARLAGVRDDHLFLALDPSAEAPRPFDEVLFAIGDGETVYLGETSVARAGGGLCAVVLPERVYRPERRLEERDEPVPAGVGRLVAYLGDEPRRWPVLEATSSGLSVLAQPQDEASLAAGRVLDVAMVVAGVGRRELFRVRVASARPFVAEGGSGVRVGLERQVERRPYDVTSLPAAPARRQQSALVRRAGHIGQAGAAVARRLLGRVGLRPPAPEVVRYENRHGETLVSIRNATRRLPADRPVPVVVVPPAYGRKKEDTAALALTLVETFANAGEPLLVVRYDGTGAVGESERSGPARDDPHYENAGFRLSRAVEDLHDTLDHLEADPSFRLGPVAVVSFSLAAVAARRAIALDGGRRVRCWVVPQGASDARDVVRNSTGGIDYLGDHRRGARRGLQTVVGHLIDTDAFCADAWEHGLADLAEARADLARIRVPITWLCGSYDYWVNAHRVTDLLSVEGTGRRELVVVPTGHVARSSAEAMAVFGLVAGRVARDLLGRTLAPRTPSMGRILATMSAERARLRRPSFCPRRYWSSYLLGKEGNPLGFDVISLTADYGDLLRAQAEALGARPGDRVVELGAGTGNAAEAVVESMPADAGGHPTELDLVDLVPEALAVARAKLARQQASGQAARATVRVHAQDLSAAGRGDLLPFGDASVDRLLASLLVSYLPEPLALLKEARRVIRPGGRLVVSSMRPDTDVSGPLAGLLARIQADPEDVVAGYDRERLVAAVRHYVNDAARLLDLATAGVFRFYEAEELASLLVRVGFTNVGTLRAFGEPGQAVVAWGERPGV